jgi:DNA-binding response OmpR family regulator
MRILVIEDEVSLADLICERLKKENYAVDVCYDGQFGLDEALNDIYDLIILDVMLPRLDGFSILKEIREEGIKAKVIMLTAKSQIDDKLNGFSKGADDYMTKPFHIDELSARVAVQLRKNNDAPKDYIEVGDLRLNTKKSSLTCIKTNEEIDVIYKEFLLLEYLMQNCGQILSKEQIYEKVWGMDNESESNNLEAYVSFIRRKIKAIGSEANIKAIRSLGYKMEVKSE